MSSRDDDVPTFRAPATVRARHLFSSVRHASLGATAAVLALGCVAAVSHYEWSLRGVHVNAERVLMPVVALLVVARLGIRPALSRLHFEHVALAVYFAVLVLASALFAPERGTSLRLAVLAGAASLPFWVIPAVVRNAQSAANALLVLALIAVAEAAFGLVTVALYTTVHVNLGMQLDPVSGGAVPFGTQWEGNLFGSFVAAGFVGVSVWVGLSRVDRPRYAAAAIGLVLMGAAVWLSASRGAWLGTLAGLLVGLVLLPRQRRRWALSILVAIAALAAVGMHFASPTSALAIRLRNAASLLTGHFDATTTERLYTYRVALESWVQHPIVGTGAGSLGQQYTYLGEKTPAWVGNLELHALHDAGVIGAVALMLALLLPVIKLFRALWHARFRGEDRARLYALQGATAAAATSLLVAFQFTEGTWLGFGWLVFGFASALPRLSAAADADAGLDR